MQARDTHDRATPPESERTLFYAILTEADSLGFEVQRISVEPENSPSLTGVVRVTGIPRELQARVYETVYQVSYPTHRFRDESLVYRIQGLEQAARLLLALRIAARRRLM